METKKDEVLNRMCFGKKKPRAIPINELNKIVLQMLNMCDWFLKLPQHKKNK